MCNIRPTQEIELLMRTVANGKKLFMLMVARDGKAADGYGRR